MSDRNADIRNSELAQVKTNIFGALLQGAGSYVAGTPAPSGLGTQQAIGKAAPIANTAEPAARLATEAGKSGVAGPLFGLFGIGVNLVASNGRRGGAGL